MSTAAARDCGVRSLSSNNAAKALIFHHLGAAKLLRFQSTGKWHQHSGAPGAQQIANSVVAGT